MKYNKELQIFFISFNKWYKYELKRYAEHKRIDRPTSEEWIYKRDSVLFDSQGFLIKK